MIRTASALVSGLWLSATLTAQLITPQGFGTVEGNSSSAYPWGRGNSVIRNQTILDSTNFLNQGINGPVLLQGCRFRANGSTTTFTGGTYNNVVIDISTAAVDYLTPSTTFASNHGANLTNVLTGSVLVGSTSGTTPSVWYVDITFATPFAYDPTLGDLCLDVSFPAGSFVASGASATPSSMDYVTGTVAPNIGLGSRVYNLTSNTALTGTTQLNLAPVIDWKVAGFAAADSYGQGCYNFKTSLYEYFTTLSAPTDLGNPAGTNAVTFLPNGSGGYVSVPGTGAWYTPTSADLLLTDDSLSAAFTLPFTFPFAGGSTTAIKVCSNGFVWLDGVQTSTDLSATVAELLSLAPRIACFWRDLNPTTIDPATTLRYGQITAEADVVSGDFVVTWNRIPDYSTGGTSTTPVRLNTFQLVLKASGAFEMRYQDCQGWPGSATSGVLAGFSEGNGANDPGMADFSSYFTTAIANTGTRLARLLLGASARPIVGTTPNLLVTNIGPNTFLGAMILSFTQNNPGVDLAAFGAPGCFQYVGFDVTNAFFPSGSSASYPLAIPNQPNLTGVQFYAQSFEFTPGYNLLGAVTSNGLSLKVGTQ